MWEDWVLQVKAMKPQDVARTWAEYLSAMMRQLTTAQTGSAEAASLAEKRISELIQEVIPLLSIWTAHGHVVVFSDDPPVILGSSVSRLLCGKHSLLTGERCYVGAWYDSTPHT